MVSDPEGPTPPCALTAIASIPAFLGCDILRAASGHEAAHPAERRLSLTNRGSQSDRLARQAARPAERRMWGPDAASMGVRSSYANAGRTGSGRPIILLTLAETWVGRQLAFPPADGRRHASPKVCRPVGTCPLIHHSQARLASLPLRRRRAFDANDGGGRCVRGLDRRMGTVQHAPAPSQVAGRTGWGRRAVRTPCRRGSAQAFLAARARPESFFRRRRTARVLP